MWEARGVGTYSKTYPGMLGLKSISLPLIILVSETPIMLNSKFNSSNRWTWKFSRFRLMDQPIPAAPSPPPPPNPGLMGAFVHLVSPGGGAFANFALPVGRAFANPGATPSFRHARGFLSKYNYTDDFTGKTSKLAHFSRTGKKWRGL